MPHLSVAIANSFIDLAKAEGQPVDPMKVQKLVYFGHGWHLGYGMGALCAESAQAWRWGPVFQDLYHAVKRWGSGPIMKPIKVFDVAEGHKITWDEPRVPLTEDFAQSLNKRIWEVYGHMSGLSLSQLTHDPAGPWSKTWNQNPGALNLEIPNSLIMEYFQQKVHANAGEARSSSSTGG